MKQQPGQQSRGSVLVVDDHAPARESVCDVLRRAGYESTGLASAAEALTLLQRQSVDVVITDLQMPGMDGLEFIRQLSRRRVASQVIMITAHASITSAVEAMRHGAFDYMEKPFDVVKLEQLVDRAMQRRRLFEPEKGESGGVPTAGRDDAGAGAGMVGDSRPMQLLRERIAQAAPTDETVLICGESGTGKELVAKALHAASRRREAPLVSLNCPALSPQLAESELFGHRRGAFTGAEADRVGRFELARGGTILLDEITEIDLPLQAKLLRVLQERTFDPVGASESCAADVRVIAATNRNLKEEVAAGRFREDLYFRLAVVPLHLPPMRERGDDVLLLADHFLRRAIERLGREPVSLAGDAQRLFLNYYWPGNVRELENIITRACVLNLGQTITAADVQPWLQEPDAAELDDLQQSPPLPVGARLEEVERDMIVATLEHFDGHRAKTAEALGIGVRTLSGKLRSYGFAPRAKAARGRAERERQELPVQSAASAEQRRREAA